MDLYRLLLSALLSICSNLLVTSAWSVNNFLMTGPKAYLTYAGSVQSGARKGIEECKHQFSWDRWNCPESALQLSTHSGARGATRETAFVHAISAAGVMHALTKNCSMGELSHCGCDDSNIGKMGGRGWMWGGCSDNVDFGENISKQFVDALENGHDARAAVNLHNNEAGRQAVRATMKRACKCHGVSGSCSIQTCWMQLADFRDVGNYLKVKHDQAQLLEMDKRRVRAGNSARANAGNVATATTDNHSNGNRGGILAEAFTTVARSELIYLESSPDYCARNLSLGLHGTEGRECLQSGDNNNLNLSQWEKRSCRRLCHECGYRVEQRRVETSSSCNCKFHWCCTVTCDTCTQVVTKYYCAPRRNKGRKSKNGSTRRRHHRNRKH
ncbi:protein Wnt-8a-like [Engraulis encrasicolus]|uniref:protein Wnt-8a-like n=1 Tax=Engraulis encrasicolus TaxID=184585 RepID=UPI002FCE8CF6